MYQEGLGGGGLENSNGTPLILHSKNVLVYSKQFIYITKTTCYNGTNYGTSISLAATHNHTGVLHVLIEKYYLNLQLYFPFRLFLSAKDSKSANIYRFPC